MPRRIQAIAPDEGIGENDGREQEAGQVRSCGTIKILLRKIEITSLPGEERQARFVDTPILKQEENQPFDVRQRKFGTIRL